MNLDGKTIYDLTIGLVIGFINVANTIFQLLFTTIEIGDIEISLWQVLTGTLLSVLIPLLLIKKFVA